MKQYCTLCGMPVKVVSGDEGTNCYEPVLPSVEQIRAAMPVNTLNGDAIAGKIHRLVKGEIDERDKV